MRHVSLVFRADVLDEILSHHRRMSSVTFHGFVYITGSSIVMSNLSSPNCGRE
jgi:hypothetical protein